MKFRASVGLSVLGAFFFALTLASSPQLHQLLHKVDAQHECAATLIASGSYQCNTPAPILPRPQDAPIAPALRPQVSELVVSAVPSSILEHAPPALI